MKTWFSGSRQLKVQSTVPVLDFVWPGDESVIHPARHLASSGWASLSLAASLSSPQFFKSGIPTVFRAGDSGMRMLPGNIHSLAMNQQISELPHSESHLHLCPWCTGKTMANQMRPISASYGLCVLHRYIVFPIRIGTPVVFLFHWGCHSITPMRSTREHHPNTNQLEDDHNS